MSSGIGSGTSSLTGLGRGDHVDLVAVARVVAGFDDAAVDLDHAALDAALHAGAREVPDAIDQVLVESASKVLGDAPVKVLDVVFLDFDAGRGEEVGAVVVAGMVGVGLDRVALVGGGGHV